MPQPQAPPPRPAGRRGNSAVAEFTPKRWQVEDHCGICSSEFSLLNTRHHCRACGLSVCGKHSKSKAIVPTSLSKVPQRVCDKCYPRCHAIAMGLMPPSVRRDHPDDKLRRHVSEVQNEQGPNGPRAKQNRIVEGAQRDNRTWNGDDDFREQQQVLQQYGDDQRARLLARDRHGKHPRARSPQAAGSPQIRDPREVVSMRGNPTHDRLARDRALHPSDLFDDNDRRRNNGLRENVGRSGDIRGRDLRERDPRLRERDPRLRERDPRLRERDPHVREREPRLQERDPRLREKDLRERDPRLRDKDLRERDPRLREKDLRERDPRLREKELRDRDQHKHDSRERNPRKVELRSKDLQGRDLRERERREKDVRAREPRERERKDRALHPRDLFDDTLSKRGSRDNHGGKERRRVVNTLPTGKRKHDPKEVPIPNFFKQASGKHGTQTSSSGRTTSSTLSNVGAGMSAYEDVNAQVPVPKSKPKRPPSRKEKELQSAFADSTFSIFSLAGSDHSDVESEAPDHAGKKVAAHKFGKSRSDSVSWESKEKKEHLDFSASSSSLNGFGVSEITQKYLAPKPPKAVPHNSSLKSPIEEDHESKESSVEPRRRKEDPRGYKTEKKCNALPPRPRKHGDEVRGEAHIAGSSHQRGKPVDAKIYKSSEISKRPSAELSPTPMQTLTSSECSEFEATQLSLSNDKCADGDKKNDEVLSELLAASEHGKEDPIAELRAKKAAIAGIDPASLDAKEKAPTTATYELTTRDTEIMQQISEQEAVVLQHQKDLPALLDMYVEATRRAKKAQRELQKAKVRASHYKKAHAAVARAIRSGRLYMKQKEYMAAILELSRAIGIERSNATLWFMMAECRLMVSQPVAAEEACMTSLNLQPTGAAVAMLGRIMHERGRHDEAIECYLSALGRNDESEDEAEEDEYE
uniref:FYVE-type domain-containing protein n=1 Tax=Hyaloperonospora arabidopsidis (strain Emoy2) TaxID=559515 RepID=M4B1V8_HYAAE